MSFGQLLVLGIVVALVGVILQLFYLPQSVADLRYRLQQNRTNLGLATSTADREAARREGRSIVFFCASRIVSSVALATVHILIVGTIALVLRTTRAAHPSAIAYELAWIRVAVSSVVIISTASQLGARWWAIHR